MIQHLFFFNRSTNVSRVIQTLRQRVMTSHARLAHNNKPYNSSRSPTSLSYFKHLIAILGLGLFTPYTWLVYTMYTTYEHSTLRVVLLFKEIFLVVDVTISKEARPCDILYYITIDHFLRRDYDLRQILEYGGRDSLFPATDAGTDSQSVSARRANNRYSLSPVGYQYDTPQTANNIFLIKQIR